MSSPEEDLPLGDFLEEWLERRLGTALKDARLDGLMETNPTEHAHAPKRDPRATEIDDELQVWTSDQARRFLDCVEDHPLRALWHLAVGTGARRGELVGLRGQDVDLSAGTVIISGGSAITPAFVG